MVSCQQQWPKVVDKHDLVASYLTIYYIVP